MWDRTSSVIGVWNIVPVPEKHVDTITGVGQGQFAPVQPTRFDNYVDPQLTATGIMGTMAHTKQCSLWFILQGTRNHCLVSSVCPEVAFCKYVKPVSRFAILQPNARFASSLLILHEWMEASEYQSSFIPGTTNSSKTIQKTVVDL